MSISQLQEELRHAEESNHYMVAIWRFDGQKLLLHRLTHDFPTSAFAAYDSRRHFGVGLQSAFRTDNASASCLQPL